MLPSNGGTSGENEDLLGLAFLTAAAPAPMSSQAATTPAGGSCCGGGLLAHSPSVGKPDVSSPQASPDLMSFLVFGDDDPSKSFAPQPRQWCTKRIILVRHARSQWNEFLGSHRKKEWQEQEEALARSPTHGAVSSTSRGAAADTLKATVRESARGLRGAIKHIAHATGAVQKKPPSGVEAGAVSGSIATGYPAGATATADEAREMSAELGGGSFATGLGREAASTRGEKAGRGLMQVVRGGVKHVANACMHVDKLHQVDHALSVGGLAQARTLRRRVAGVVATPEGSIQGATSALLECRTWYVSPFLRALQTAAYALSPLLRREPSIRIIVWPEANEIMTSQLSMDCQGKKGNVGHRLLARAVARTAELFEEDEDDPDNQMLLSERQAELLDMSTTLCAMDLGEVSRTWWKDVGTFSKQGMKAEDLRVRRLVNGLLRQPDQCVGLVAHSLLFQRILQMFWPQDASVGEQLRVSLRNGAPAETKDPFHDKIMNCGTLVLTFRYCEVELDLAMRSAEIVAAEFLFEGHMEGALSDELRSLETSAIDEIRRSESESYIMAESEQGSPELPRGVLDFSDAI